MKKLDIVGKKFNNLLVIWYEWIRKWETQFKCRCNCWNEIIIKWTAIKRWRTKSCGCLKKINEQNKTHWMSKSRFYLIYVNIVSRCIYSSVKQYKDYWWRWIKTLRNTFEEFRDDMYKSYLEHCEKFWEKETTIERLNNNWHYCKDNCKRVTIIEQANNKRNNNIITINWISKTLIQRSRIYWIWCSTVWARIYKYWWEPMRAIITPPQKLKRKLLDGNQR